jgi:phosphoribosylanthranilate isomerase
LDQLLSTFSEIRVIRLIRRQNVLSNMVRVKICGITNEDDARTSIALGASALGFNTWSGSKRFLDLAHAGRWIAGLPPFVTRVALLVNAPLEEAERVARLPFIDALQLHGDEDAAYCAAVARFGRPFIKALRLRSAAALEGLERFATPHFLIDAHVEGQFGGTGVAADLALAREFTARYPRATLILAGGLRAENVAAAVRDVRPFGVDVSSGVVAGAGRKDAALVRAFVEAAHRA